MRRRKVRTLALNRETLRSLEAGTLQGVAGGVTGNSECPSECITCPTLRQGCYTYPPCVPLTETC